jgi:hypothetical protein
MAVRLSIMEACITLAQVNVYPSLLTESEVRIWTGKTGPFFGDSGFDQGVARGWTLQLSKIRRAS